ncbi:putative oxydoreductase, zinc-containing domain protein, partial [Acinetobacter baumannii 754286]
MEFHLNYQQTKVNQHVLNINQTWSISMNLPTTMKIVEIT